MPNVFKDARKEENSIPRIKPTEIDQDDLFDLIENFEEDSNKVKEINKSLTNIKSSLKNIALNEYIKKYQEDGKNPGTIIIEAINAFDEEGEFMFVPSDRYVTIRDEDQANEIEEKYGENIIERELIYSFDPDMLDKYYDVISKLISECDDIPIEDKGKLFIASETYKIKKGTIDRFGEIVGSGDIKDIFEGLKPVVSLKDPKVIKS